MEHFSLSYREIIPDLSHQENWNEIILNTGGTQSTLQDIKVAEKAGGYCFKNVSLIHNRNRFIYWRTYQDVLELSEISLDFNLYQNSLRYKFSDSPVLSVNITEREQFVTLLVTTVNSLHRINFPHPDTLATWNEGGTAVDLNEAQTFSIFREASATAARDPANFYVIAQNTSSHNPVPHAAASFLSPYEEEEEAYFALAYQTQLILYVMNITKGQTTSHILKEHYMMPRLFTNLKGALIGKSNSSDNDNATSLVFSELSGQIFLLALYRDDILRMWSTTSMKTVCSISCVRECTEQRMQGPQNSSLRKINDHNVCAFLSHSTGSEFVCIGIQPDSNSGNYNMIRRKTISAPKLDLADFDVSETRIWALWCNAEGEFSISNFCLVRGMNVNWVSAAMEPPPDRYWVGADQGMDPREAYCSYIFHPGKFDRSVIVNALFMFRRSSVRFYVKNSHLVKDYVCQSVEEEIQNEIKDYDITDDEYLEISARLWERFYSCCEQYHMKACQPTGLLLLDPIDAVCVIKKNTFSLLRPCETLEHLMLAGENVDTSVIVPVHFAGNENIGIDLVTLITMIAVLEKLLPEDVKIDLDKKLYQLENPKELIEKLTYDILEGDADKEILSPEFLDNFRQKLQGISELRTPMGMLLDSLRMDNGNPEAMHFDLAQTSRFLSSIGSLFGSNIGISLLSETVRQMSQIRFALCRNLLIIQQILLDTLDMSTEILDAIRSQFMPDTITFFQSYYVMVWITETPVNISLGSTLDSSIQRLNLLQLTNGSGRVYSDGGKTYSASLLRVFLNAKGLYTALGLYAESFKSLDNPTWQQTLIPLTTIVSQLIWAVSCNFVFGEWLFSTCQHIIIEDYVRLLNNWCKWNFCSRKFILAVSILDCGESHKAYDLFLQAAGGILNENFLSEKILKRVENATNDNGSINEKSVKHQTTANYYLKVIQLFEQHNALDHIISMAQVAIEILDKSDPQLPMFQSIVFNNHLILEHYEEAYESLICNVELPRRKDCLRQLVVTLFTKKRPDLLMNFPYVGLQEEFENIVESRARSLAIENNEIYDFLNAFHVSNGNMRKASSIMYEQAMRCQLECDSMEAMQKRCFSLLICINSLHLIDERYRWIAKPVTSDEYVSAGISVVNGDKMDIDEKIVTGQVVVLEIKDIQQELLHTEALIRLAQHRDDIVTFFNAGPQELSMVLASSGLFTAALKLARGHSISILPIFDNLTTACVRTADENPTEAWNWLQDNDLADIPHRSKAADMAWSLLRKLIEDNEEENSTLIRKNVVNKLLSLNAFIPQWLYDAYKAANCAELLRLFVKHNRLLEANELAIEMIRAMLGVGSEYFSFKHPIGLKNPELCLPINVLDILLYGLKANGESDIEYKQALIELEEIIAVYLEKAAEIAENKIQDEYLKAARNR